MKTLYFECNTGISGDMTVGALLDLGADRKVLTEGLKSLAFDGYELKFGRTKKAGIDAFDFDVLLGDEHHHHGGGHSHSHEEHHSCGNVSNHGKDDVHNHNGHTNGDKHQHVHRNLPDILHLIHDSKITPKAKAIAEKVFRILGEAEAKAHGIPIDQVHFHEVGAVDSIVDIVGAAICIDNLGADRILASPLGEGSGFVNCAHGKMPVPVPAVVNIASANHVPLKSTGIQGELVTPTGIALISAVADSFTAPDAMNIRKIGYGAGNKDIPGHANVLRVYLLEDESESEQESVSLIETNIDDQTPETLAFACELLLEKGALDVWCEPICMKKGRAAQKLCVLCRPDDERMLTELIFLHTTSIGVRKSNFSREIMHREIHTIQTCYGEIEVKHCEFGLASKDYVEYESAKSAAIRENVTIQQVIDETLRNICR